MLTDKCEICDKEVDTKYLGKYKNFQKLCPECLKNEIQSLFAMRSETVTPSPDLPKDLPKDLTEPKVFTEHNITEHELIITTKDEFWNAENTQLEKLSGKSPFERYQIVSNRLTNWQSILFEAQQSIAADYIYLQQIKVELTNEERKALKIAYTDYNPGELNPANVKPTVAKKPRESADQRAARSIAESLYAKRIRKGEELDKKLFETNPEKWNNGYILPQFAEERKELFKSNNALTLDEAIELSQKMITDTKQQHFDSIGKKGDDKVN